MSETAEAAGTAAAAGPSTQGPAAAKPGHEQLPRSISSLIFIRDRGIVVLWILLIIMFAIVANPFFATVSNAMLILNAGAITAIFAAAIAVGVFSGSLDLSVPGVAAFAGMICAWLIVKQDLPTWVGIAAGLAFGLLIGFINARITLLGLNPLVVTIGTLTVLTGLAAVVGGGYTIPGVDKLAFMGTDTYFDIPQSWNVDVHPWLVFPDYTFQLGGFDGVPGPVFVMFGVFIVMTIFFTKTRGGIRLMAVGGNEEAVRRVGLSSKRYRSLGFMLSGLLAALGGLTTAAYVGEANPQASPSIIFDGLTAVALAGVALSGGRGSLPKVLVGALILATISDGLTIAGADPYWATVTTGLLLVGALVADLLLTKTVSRRLVTVGNLSVHGKKA